MKAAACLLTIVAMPGVAQEATPPPAAAAQADAPRSEDTWFARHLEVLGVTSLRDAAVLAGYRERFRLLVLPSFSRPYVVTIDQAHNGRVTMRLVQVSGLRGDGSDRITRTEVRRVGVEGWKQLQAAIAAARLGDGLTGRHESRDEFGRQLPPSPVPSVPECADGAKLVFERRTPSAYTLVRRHDCSLDAGMRTLLDTTLAHTGHTFLDGIVLTPDRRD